jgi:hypothetical protein
MEVKKMYQNLEFFIAFPSRDNCISKDKMKLDN